MSFEPLPYVGVFKYSMGSLWQDGWAAMCCAIGEEVPEMTDIRKVLESSGLWNTPVTPGSLKAVRAFYSREWPVPCTWDDICVLASKTGANSVNLIEMAEAAGELMLE